MTEINGNPQSTWGKTPETKIEWRESYVKDETADQPEPHFTETGINDAELFGAEADAAAQNIADRQDQAAKAVDPNYTENTVHDESQPGPSYPPADEVDPGVVPDPAGEDNSEIVQNPDVPTDDGGTDSPGVNDDMTVVESKNAEETA